MVTCLLGTLPISALTPLAIPVSYARIADELLDRGLDDGARSAISWFRS